MYNPHYSLQKADSSKSGVGYGGNQSDSAIVKQKLREAQRKSLKEDLDLIEFFKTNTSLISTSVHSSSIASISEDLRSNIAAELKDCFRSQVPTDWSARSNLYNAALDLSKIICSDLSLTASILTNDEKADQEEGEDYDTVISYLRLFASQASLIQSQQSSHKKGEDKKVLNLICKVVDVCKAADISVAQAKSAGLISISLLDDNDCDGDIMAVSSISEEEAKVYKRKLGSLRFGLVDHLPGHAFAGTRQPASFNTRKIFKELTSYATTLPVEHGSSVFVRAVDGRLDLIRALITGPEETPYANGCFIFDIHLPGNYPTSPPKFKLLTTGNGKVRFNPNLYNCGKVCLSLLGTWSGPGWISGQSTLLQVLISIQSLILVPDPYFNEPGYMSSKGTPSGDKASEQYDMTIRANVTRWAIQDHLQNYSTSTFGFPEFKDILENHFAIKSLTVGKQMDLWIGKEQNSQDLMMSSVNPLGYNQSRKASVITAANEVKHLLTLLPNLAITPNYAKLNTLGKRRRAKRKALCLSSGVIDLIDDDGLKPSSVHHSKEVITVD